MPRRNRYAEPTWLGPGVHHLRYWQGQVENPCFVYVIQGEGGGPIKVGVAKDVAARMAGLQTGNPTQLQVLYVMPGDHRLEAFLHRRLKGAWLRGEWFHGPAVDPFLMWVKALSKRMVRHHRKTGQMPDYTCLNPPEPIPKAPVRVRSRHMRPTSKASSYL